jgi:RNA polymerase sigma factor (sigma-70 family)
MCLVDPRRARFDALYADHYRAVYAYVYRRLALSADVPDVTADVFAVVWRRLDDVPAGDAELLWLYGVARRCVARARRGYLRRVRLFGRLVEEAGRRADPPSAESRTPEVRVAIERLRARDREVLRLIMWEQLSHAEAAVVLGCSANAVAQRLHTARERLRAELARPDARSLEPIEKVDIHGP